jgi:hypothetical protein
MRELPSLTRGLLTLCRHARKISAIGPQIARMNTDQKGYARFFLSV